MQALGNSRDRFSTSGMEAASISRMAMPARCLAMLVRISSRDWTWRTDVKLLARAETSDCAILESLCRSTTLRGCILSSGFFRWHGDRAVAALDGVNAVTDVNTDERYNNRWGLYLFPAALSVKGS